ncbi:SWIM zinc finger family protein [Jannaschia pohangensis]|uniref:SWIM zinc finger n=1 Tax=Jannaschia pohangensis TaxID=390807 RepID=A0A1I3T9Z2_9RHOB|nr:SWIM zinc finger family protein [Jannaschia pohangensis]SFJ67322.1 SWIM zinc finger [Jannaschia pohangensis]
MTALAQMLATWDEAALTGLVSKGIVIRAGKDAATATIRDRSDGGATVVTGGATVSVTAPDLRAARCDCGTPFPCRHVIAAVIALRMTAPASTGEPSPSATEVPDVIDIATLPFSDIKTFAGTDWSRALALTGEAAQITGDTTRAVTFPETAETVTFPVGLGLKQALYKGKSASRTRMAVAAAALVLARASGRDLPEVTVENATARADPQTLDRIEAALGEAAVALSAGALPQAATRLFTLAISTRAEAVPRLAAELRGLSRRMTDEALRRADETPEKLLLALGRTHALTRALRFNPEDPALVGTLARSFAPSGPMDVIYLGSESWRTLAGARGLTSVFVNPATGTIHRATEARAAGTDLTFEPRQSWSTPLWGLMPPSRMKGRLLHLPDAALAPDGGLGLTQKATDAGEGGEVAGITSWADLRPAFDAQMGRGLRQRPGEALLLLTPKTTDAPVFDPYAQRWVWTWQDAEGVAVDLRLPTDMLSDPRLLDPLTRRVTRGLVALAPGGAMRLMSLWLGGSAAGHYVLQFDTLPKPVGWTALVDRIRDKVAAPAARPPAPPDPLRLALDRAAEAVLASLTRPNAPRPIDQTRAIGLARIAEGLDSLDGTAATALPTAYLLALAQNALGDRA